MLLASILTYPPCDFFVIEFLLFPQGEGRVIKAVIVGDGGAGKSTLLRLVSTGEFSPQYVSTLGYEHEAIRFYTTDGLFTIKIVDTAGQESFGQFRRGTYLGCDGAIFCLDRCNFGSRQGMAGYIKEFLDLDDKKRTAVCVCTKVDMFDKRIFFSKTKCAPHGCNVSVPAWCNVNQPFLDLIRGKTDKPTIEFAKEPAPRPVHDDEPEHEASSDYVSKLAFPDSRKSFESMFHFSSRPAPKTFEGVKP